MFLGDPSVGMMATGGGIFCALKFNSNAGFISQDGTIYTGTTLSSSHIWESVIYDGANFIGIADSSSQAITSPDGINWTNRTITSRVWKALATKGTRTVAIAQGGTGHAAYTDDHGVTWTDTTLPSSAQWWDVKYNGSVFFAFEGNTSSTKGATSTDGITWTARTIPSGTWFALQWTGSLFVLVGTNSCATSPDGITWTTRTIPSGQYRGLGWNGVTLVAINGNNTNVAATSPDGITWTARTMSASDAYEAIAWNGSIFIAPAIDNNTAQTTIDGVTWNNVTGLPSNNWTALCSSYLLFGNY